GVRPGSDVAAGRERSRTDHRDRSVSCSAVRLGPPPRAPDADAVPGASPLGRSLVSVTPEIWSVESPVSRELPYPLADRPGIHSRATHRSLDGGQELRFMDAWRRWLVVGLLAWSTSCGG